MIMRFMKTKLCGENNVIESGGTKSKVGYFFLLNNEGGIKREDKSNPTWFIQICHLALFVKYHPTSKL